jgi:hypothetical protein
MGKSKIDFQEIIQDYNKSFIEHVHNEAMMYERLYDNRSKDIE